MTRTERQKIKRKARTTMFIAMGCVILPIINLILVFGFNWRPAFIENVHPEWVNIVTVLIVILIFYVPMILGLFFNSMSLTYKRKLKSEKNRLYKKQLRMYTEWFFNAIKDDDPSRAIALHNSLIWGESKALTRGVLMGYLFKGEDKEEMERALRNMDSVLNEIYNPVVEKF